MTQNQVYGLGVEGRIETTQNQAYCWGAEEKIEMTLNQGYGVFQPETARANHEEELTNIYELDDETSPKPELEYSYDYIPRL